MPGDGHFRQLFGLAPLNIPVDLCDDDSDGSSCDSFKEEVPLEVPQQAVLLQRMDLLGNDDYLLRVRHVLNLRSHVIVAIQESTHKA
jgi:hypothetical protein